MDFILGRFTEASSASGLGLILMGIKAFLAGDTVTGIGSICLGIGGILIPERRKVA